MKLTTTIHYAVLILILLGGMVAFYYARPNTSVQFIVGIITSIAYVLWGYIHHTLQKDLHMRVMIEYILMAAIAVVLLATVLKT